jgi:hypothetical protein
MKVSEYKNWLIFPKEKPNALNYSTKHLYYRITLHAAAAAESTSNRVIVSCNCKAVCTGCCQCKKNQVQFSMYCHADEHDCGNLSPLTTRTEIAVVNRTPGTKRAEPAGRLSSRGLSARKRTDTTVGGQSTARVTREWHAQGQEEE